MELFDNADIKGRIKDVFILHRGTGIQIVGDPNSYLVYETGDKNIIDVAEDGDSISKRRYSDTLYFFKKGELIKFHFHRQFR